MLGREADDQLAVNDNWRAGRHDQTAIRVLRECRETPLNLARLASVDCTHSQAEKRPNGLGRTKLAASRGKARVPNNRCAGNERRDLLKQFQQLTPETVFECAEAGRVAARLAQAGDESAAD